MKPNRYRSPNSATLSASGWHRTVPHFASSAQLCKWKTPLGKRAQVRVAVSWSASGHGAILRAHNSQNGTLRHGAIQKRKSKTIKAEFAQEPGSRTVAVASFAVLNISVAVRSATERIHSESRIPL